MIRPYRIATHNPEFKHLEDRPIAFFSAEYALEDDLPIYAGGLGVLAGDFLLEAGAQGLPMAAVGLFYRRGFETFTPQAVAGVLANPGQAGFSLLRAGEGQPLLVEVEVGGRIVFVQVWKKSYGSVELFLLDTDVDRNPSADRSLTEFLYPREFQTKLLQEVVFGLGGIKLFRKLGVTPALYHLNEGHTGFAVLGAIVEYMHEHPDTKDFTSALDHLRPQIVATKHTILPGSGLFFSRSDFHGILDVYLSRHKLSFDSFCSIGAWENDPNIFSMTKFLLQSAARVNAVSQAHALFERQIHPRSQLFPITNAINLERWQAPKFSGEALGLLSDQDFWKIHTARRQALVDFVKSKTGASLLDPGALTLVWARRFASYKRPTLLFSDARRLKRIVSDAKRPVQIVISGQPNASDEEGIGFLKEILSHTKQQPLAGKVVWLPDYSIKVAKTLVLGADLWLNTPRRGQEASGTSGMKSAANGGLQFSTPDGWTDEIDWSGRGWILTEDHIETRLYDILEKEIIPLFYERTAQNLPLRWIEMMRRSVKTVQDQYSTKRMFREYLEKLYFPNP